MVYCAPLRTPDIWVNVINWNWTDNNRRKSGAEKGLVFRDEDCALPEAWGLRSDSRLGDYRTASLQKVQVFVEPLNRRKWLWLRSHVDRRTCAWRCSCIAFHRYDATRQYSTENMHFLALWAFPSHKPIPRRLKTFHPRTPCLLLDHLHFLALSLETHRG